MRRRRPPAGYRRGYGRDGRCRDSWLATAGDALCCYCTAGVPPIHLNRHAIAVLFAAPLFVDTLENFADRRARKTARREKARLLRALSRGLRKLTEFLTPHSLSARQFGFAQLSARLLDQRLIYRVLLQFADDPARAKPRRAAMDEAFGKPRIGQPVLGLQRVEQRIERVAFFDEGFQLAREFAAAVLTTRQIAERTPFEGTCGARGFFRLA